MKLAPLLLSASSYLSSLLFEFLDGSLVNAPTFVDKVARGGGLARVHMADHDNVDVEFFLSHVVWSWLKSRDRLSAKARVKLQLVRVTDGLQGRKQKPLNRHRKITP